MGWLIKIDDATQKDLAKMDKPLAKRIIAFLRQRVSVLDNPRSIVNRSRAATVNSGATA